MTENQHNNEVGDCKSPSLMPQGATLRQAVDQALTMVAEPPPNLHIQSAVASMISAVKPSQAVAPTSCQQQLWFSFFFDGTGNNLDADVGTLKHSNVAKLYRVHQSDDAIKGVYRIYLPGVGTYFREVGDNDSSTLGLGAGRMGDARLNWAVRKFDEKMMPHLARANSPGNTILEVNFALFGFSRGAALARAFANKLLDERGVLDQRKGWCLKNGGHRLRIRFMGLFDTVASVGTPMSTNTVSKLGTIIGIKKILHDRLTDPDYIESIPRLLAFSEGANPGADPAPGVFDGHQDWGGKMAIPHMVEEVRHFIAAHEIRNSFPVDSVSVLEHGKVVKPAHFHESVYPGAHSDVGGSYRSGEGARSYGNQEKLGLIPLHSMFQYALDRAVPLLPKTAWGAFNRSDFEIDPTLLQRYNYYQKKVAGISNLGPLINAHMALYYAWRFRAIRRKSQGDDSEAKKITIANQEFQENRRQIDAEISVLEKDDFAAMRDLADAEDRRLDYLGSNYSNSSLKKLPDFNEKLKEAQSRQSFTRDKLMWAKARRDALPNMSNFATLVDMYDQHLIEDVRSIREAYTARGIFGSAPNSTKRNELRPHYRVMIEAYENEYIHNKGLRDEVIIAFFDNYVHDSLAGFAKDATLPSDPRVVYLGGDEKYRYAIMERQRQGVAQYASAVRVEGREFEI